MTTPQKPRERKTSVSSTSSLEDGELDVEYTPPPTIDQPPARGRTNGNIWRDTAIGQSIQDNMLQNALSSGLVTERGTESYELPDFEKMDKDTIIRQQQLVNESLKRVVRTHNNDLFGPGEFDLDTVYGADTRTYRKRKILSNKIPLASSEALRNREEGNSGNRHFGSTNFKRPKWQNGTSRSSSRSGGDRPSTAASSEAGDKKQKFSGPGKQASSKPATFVDDEQVTMPCPFNLMPAGWSQEEFFAAELDVNLPEEGFGTALAEALGEENVDLFIFAVETLGIETCARLFKRTQEVERHGGMLIDKKTRRRTPGGVFVKLLRIDKYIPNELRDEVRDYSKESYERFEKHKKEAQKPVDPVLPSAKDVLKPCLDSESSPVTATVADESEPAGMEQ